MLGSSLNSGFIFLLKLYHSNGSLSWQDKKPPMTTIASGNPEIF
jgi:hypothetical protein